MQDGYWGRLLTERLTRRRALASGATAGLGLAALSLVGCGGGSDSDDALNLATRALLHGEYPYRIRTYLGSPATYLPGSLLLAVPFVLLGNAAYQDLFWLAAFLLSHRTLRLCSFVAPCRPPARTQRT